MTDTPITPAPAPAATAPALPAHIAALDPATREVALKSLAKAGRTVPAAAPVPALAANPATPPATPAPDLRVSGNTIRSDHALAHWQTLRASAAVDPAKIADPEARDAAIKNLDRAERFRQAYIADHGIDPDAALGATARNTYGIPEQPSGYDVKLDQRFVTDDPAAQTDFREGFSEIAHHLELPSHVASAMANDIVEAATRFQSLSPEAKTEYLGKGGIDPAVKQEIAGWLGFPDFERAKATFQAALKPVLAKMSADDIEGLIESGALNSARVLMRLIYHGRALAARQPQS